jgi:hypothetical protein
MDLMRALWLLLACVALSVWATPVGACENSVDCEVRGAACRDAACRISDDVFLFPGLKDLEEIELLQPAGFGLTNDEPSLRWQAPLGTSLVAAGIFRELPRYSAKRPGNISDLDASAVWVWLSESESAGTGLARFRDGRVPEADPTLGVRLGREVPALKAGIYYWGVWAWSGSKLSHRSRLRSFTVGDEQLTGAPCEFTEALVNLQCTRSVTGLDYQVIACASDADCYEGTTCDLTIDGLDFSGGLCRGACDCRADCACDDDAVCDAATGICASASSNQTPPIEGPAACGCRTAGSPAERASVWAATVFLALALAGARRSGKAIALVTQPNVISNATGVLRVSGRIRQQLRN